MHNLKNMFQKELALFVLVLIICAMPLIVNASTNYTIIDADDIQSGSQIEYNISNEIEHILTSTLGEAVGMQGFYGDHAINNPTEVVEIIVQFVTPPEVALRIMVEEGISREHSVFGTDFRAQALAAHTAFQHNLNKFEYHFLGVSRHHEYLVSTINFLMVPICVSRED